MPAEFWWKFSAIVVIAASLLFTLFREMKKPKKDPNLDPDTKRMNDMLKD
ncbi:hypothetical protein [Hydrogenimonas sp. SS33]